MVNYFEMEEISTELKGLTEDCGLFIQFNNWNYDYFIVYPDMRISRFKDMIFVFEGSVLKLRVNVDNIEFIVKIKGV